MCLFIVFANFCLDFNSLKNIFSNPPLDSCIFSFSSVLLQLSIPLPFLFSPACTQEMQCILRRNLPVLKELVLNHHFGFWRFIFLILLIWALSGCFLLASTQVQSVLPAKPHIAVDSALPAWLSSVWGGSFLGRCTTGTAFCESHQQLWQHGDFRAEQLRDLCFLLHGLLCARSQIFTEMVKSWPS